MAKEYMQVANTIMRQIHYPDQMVVWSWGFHSPVGMPPKKGMRGGALRFDVNGAKFQGRVMVELTFTDDYTVSLLDENGNPSTVKEGIYADQLQEVVDNLVETN